MKKWCNTTTKFRRVFGLRSLVIHKKKKTAKKCARTSIVALVRSQKLTATPSVGTGKKQNNVRKGTPLSSLDKKDSDGNP